MICASGYEFPLPPIYAGAMGELSKKIKAIRISLGMNQTEFGEVVGASQSTVTRWEQGSQPAADYLQKIADLSRITVDELLGFSVSSATSDDIPVVGYVGAGAAVYPMDDYAHGVGLDFVERPPFVEGKAVAVEVRGDSLFPVAENGWRLVYAGDQTLIEEDVLNRLCVVQLEDGRILVKRIQRGTLPQHYHLASTNAPLIEDVRVLWAARVKAIIPT